MNGEVQVVLIGTDPKNPKGGIGTAMAGYNFVLQTKGLLAAFIPTYRPQSLTGKFLPALKAIFPVIVAVKRIRRQGAVPVVYGHAGGWPAILREGLVLSFAKLMGAKTLLQLHSPALDSYLRHFLGRLLLRVLGLVVDGFGVVTPWWKMRFDNCGLGDKVTVIPNPLPEKCDKIARSTISKPRVDYSERLHVVCMARLVSGKGVAATIQALSELPDSFFLTVGGDGPLRNELGHLVSKLGLERRVKFVGWLDEEQKHRLLDQADVFCLPSLADSFGMVFIEAMAHGVPVVATGWGPIYDVVQDEKTGILIDGQDPHEVATALRRLADPALRHHLAAEAPRWILDRFSTEVVGLQLVEWITGIAATEKLFSGR